jgi:NDP-sugar pyrophosphorylase family protein
LSSPVGTLSAGPTIASIGRLATESELIERWLGESLEDSVVFVPSKSELGFAFRSAEEEVTGANEGDVKSRFESPATFLALKSDHPASVDTLRLASMEEGAIEPDVED